MNANTPAAKISSGQPSTAATAGESSTTDRMAQAAHNAVDIAAANLAQAEEALREARHAAGITASESARQAQAVTEESLNSAREYIQANPLRAVGIALAAGFLTSVLLRK